MKQYIIRYRDYKITKTVYSSGKTKLVLGVVMQQFKTEQEADKNLDNFLMVAVDINANNVLL